MRKWILPALLLVLPSLTMAQGNAVVIPFNGVPTGTCAFIMFARDTTTDALYSCSAAGTWVAVATSSGVGGDFLPTVDNTYTLGNTSFRWSNVFAVTGNFSTVKIGSGTLGDTVGALIAVPNNLTWLSAKKNGSGSCDFGINTSNEFTSTCPINVTSGASGMVPVLLYSGNCTTSGNCATQANTTGTGGNLNSSNGTAGTSELIFALKYTIPASYIVSGRVITVCWVIEQTVGASSPNATMRMKLGSTNVYATSTTILTINNASARGSTTCIPIQGTTAAGASVNVETGGMFTPVLTQQAVMNSVAQPVALATNGTLALQLSWQWASNPGAGYSVTLRQLWVVGY